jgi:hypothetical protein
MSQVFHPFGHLEGVVTKINDHGRGYVTFEVTAVNGVTCFGSDIHGDVRPFPIAVGRQILLEEADVIFENGQIVYTVDERLRGVELDGQEVEYVRKGPSIETLTDLKRFVEEGSFASAVGKEG